MLVFKNEEREEEKRLTMAPRSQQIGEGLWNYFNERFYSFSILCNRLHKYYGGKRRWKIWIEQAYEKFFWKLKTKQVFK